MSLLRLKFKLIVFMSLKSFVNSDFKKKMLYSILIKINFWIVSCANWIVWELWNFFLLKYTIWLKKRLEMRTASERYLVAPYFHHTVLSISATTSPNLHYTIFCSGATVNSGKRMKKLIIQKNVPCATSR